MIREYKGLLPHAEDGVWIAEDADVIGQVSIGRESSVFFHSVIRADSDAIIIGKQTNIQDGCILHTDPAHQLIIEDGVSVGHGAILHGCHIQSHCLIGMGAVILNGAQIEPYCIIGAGAVVKEGMHIPSGSLAFGCPARIVRAISEEQKADIEHNALHYVALAKEYAGGKENG